jgi:hypothetical protein
MRLWAWDRLAQPKAATNNVAVKVVRASFLMGNSSHSHAGSVGQYLNFRPECKALPCPESVLKQERTAGAVLSRDRL